MIKEPGTQEVIGLTPEMLLKASECDSSRQCVLYARVYPLVTLIRKAANKEKRLGNKEASEAYEKVVDHICEDAKDYPSILRIFTQEDSQRES